jgi:hypothetical protein
MGLLDNILMAVLGEKVVVRFEAITVDGKKLHGKTSIESFGMERWDLECELQNILWVERGIRTKSLKIIGVC